MTPLPFQEPRPLLFDWQLLVMGQIRRQACIQSYRASHLMPGTKRENKASSLGGANNIAPSTETAKVEPELKTTDARFSSPAFKLVEPTPSCK